MSESLVKAGAAVNALNNQLRSPLHIAVNAFGHKSQELVAESEDTIDAVEYLIESGGDLFATDVMGRLPLHYAFVKLKP